MSKNKNEFNIIIERLKGAGSILCVSHVNPDGDAIGCACAVVRAARAAGKQADVVFDGNVPQKFEFLMDDISPLPAEQFSAHADNADVICVLDTCSFSQLNNLADAIRRLRSKTIVIDHHASGDPVGDVQWADPKAGATGLLVYELLDAMGWEMDFLAKQSLAVAMLTDTGWMRFPNTCPRILRTVAKLVDSGVRIHDLFKRIDQTDRPQRLALLGRILSGTEFFCDSQLAVMCVEKKDFAETGATQDETEDLINETLRVGSVELAVLLVERDDFLRVSFRSRESASGSVDCCELAKKFDGGGHVRAAGAKLKEEISSAREKIIEECKKTLNARPIKT